ncbi:hypothetical protein BsWGS_10265 [Bradybaena similaris]
MVSMKLYVLLAVAAVVALSSSAVFDQKDGEKSLDNTVKESYPPVPEPSKDASENGILNGEKEVKFRSSEAAKEIGSTKPPIGSTKPPIGSTKPPSRQRRWLFCWFKPRHCHHPFIVHHPHIPTQRLPPPPPARPPPHP